MINKRFVPARKDICQRDIIRYTEYVYPEWNHNDPAAPLGERTNVAFVLSESYGKLAQQHTFTLKVLDSKGYGPLQRGVIIHRKGRRIYKGLKARALWNNEDERRAALAEKHARGKEARAARNKRREKQRQYYEHVKSSG